MKNKLLITTALVAFVSASNAVATERVISTDITNLTNTEPTRSGALLVDYGDKVTISDNVNITDNTSTIGAAGGIKALNGFTAGNNLNVSNNKSEKKMGGGMYIRLADDTHYTEENKATATNRNVVIGDNATISNNSSKWLGGGMAIESAEKVTIGNGATFEGNHSDAEGGAIAIWSDASNKLNGKEFDNKTLLELGQSRFIKNTSGSTGGAIANINENTVNIAAGSLFDGNKAASNGGAIYNEGTLNIGANTVFSNNTSTANGGAIFNDTSAKLALSGNNIFSGNMANGALNDIHNLGNIDASGSLTLDGGISGDGTLTLAKDTNLNVKTGTTTISNKVVNNGANLGLTFDNGFTGKYELITNGGTLDNEFNIAENGIYNIETDDQNKGTYNISKKNTGEISASTGASSNQANTVNAVTNGKSDNIQFNLIANNISNLMQSTNESDVQTGLNAVTALAPETAAMVQSASTENANQVFGAVGSRLSGGSISSSSEGMASGDSVFDRGAMWVQGLFNKTKLDDTSKAKGFDADSNGVALGAEKQIDRSTKAGVGYAYTNTDIDGFMRKTDVDTHTAILYGEYKPSNWFVNGIATYGWSDYSEKKNVAGSQVKADYDVNAFGLQAMTGYDLFYKNVKFTPEAGLRYVNIKQDSYRDSVDQRVGSNSSDILTGVIGAKVKQNFVLNSGMNLRPEARLAMTYDLTNDDANSIVSLANGSAYQVKGEALDRFGVEVGAGLTADINDRVELSVGYEGKFRQDYQDHTGLLNAKYKF